MTATTAEWVSALEAHLGETEQPPGSNCCPVCRAYGPIGSSACYAWCCATQDLVSEAVFGRRMLRTAAVGQAWENAKAGLNGLEALDVQSEIRVGDLYCMDLKGARRWNDMHIGGVVNPDVQYSFGGIEGNWGNQCLRKQRDRKYVFGFIRMPFDLVVPVPGPPQGGEAMDTFICEFLDVADVRWLVTLKSDVPGQYGTKMRISDPAHLNQLLATGVRNIVAPIPGGNTFAEVAGL